MKRILLSFLMLPLFYSVDAQIFVRPNLTSFVGASSNLNDTGYVYQFSSYANNLRGNIFVRGQIDTMQATPGPYMNFYSSFNGSDAIQNGVTTYKARTTMQNELTSRQGFFNNAIYNSVVDLPGVSNTNNTSGLLNDLNSTRNETNGVYNFAFANINAPKINGMQTYINKPDSNDLTTVNGVFNEIVINNKGDTRGIHNKITVDSRATGKIYGVYSQMLHNGLSPTKPNSHKIVAIYGEVDTSANYGTQEVYAGQFIGKVQVQGTLSATTLVQTSDEKLKDDIRNLSNSLDVIKRLNPKSYFLKSEVNEANRKRHIGFVAQDIETVLPDLVSTIRLTTAEKYKITTVKQLLTASERKPNGENSLSMKEISIPRYEKVADEVTTEVKSVNYIEMIPLLLQAIKEQQDIIEQLQRDVEILKRRN